MFARAAGANATPIAFAEVYLALQNGTVDAAENLLPTIQAKKFYEVQSHISITGHITDSLLTIIGSGTMRRLNEGGSRSIARSDYRHGGYHFLRGGKSTDRESASE